MKMFFILMTVFLFITACEQEELIDTDNNGNIFDEKPNGSIDKSNINGLWESNGYYDGKMTQKVRLRIEEDQAKVTMGSECKYIDGKVLYVQIDADATIKDNVVTVDKAEQDYKVEQKGAISYECFAMIPAGTLKISLNGKINLDGGFVFSKISN